MVMCLLKNCFISLATTLTVLSVASSQCLDESGTVVDWYVVYKIPKIITDLSSCNYNGTSYMYLTSKSVNQEWIRSQYPISSEHSLVARTLAPLYKDNLDDIQVIYNDQYDGKSSESFGHTKGVVGANKNNGYWLIHSVPEFPPITNKYSYPESGIKNGQSMLCISLPENQIDRLGTIFMYNKPKVVWKRIGNAMATLYPNLVAAAKGLIKHKEPWSKSSIINSIDGRNFTNFAKGNKFNKDLYEWVATTFQIDLLAETWQNEVQPFPSSCTQYKVLNVEEIEFENQSLSFSSHKDHSKWAVSKDAGKPWICIGDINRALPQTKRGGGTTCLRDRTLWKAYRNIITKTSQCKMMNNNNNLFY